MPVIKYKEWNCELEFAKYADNGNTAIELVDAETGEPISTATVNLGVKLPKNQAFIKDYSENEGMLNYLIEAGVVSQPIRYQRSGYIQAPLVDILIPIE